MKIGGGRVRHDAAIASDCLSVVSKWLPAFAEYMSQLRNRKPRRRSSRRFAQHTESYEARILLAGMPPFAAANSYSLSKDSYTVAASGVLANDTDMESDPLTASLYSSPTSLEAVLTFNGVAGSTTYYNTTGISGTTRLRFALQADASSLATGKYAWSMSLKGKYSDGSSSTRNFTGSSYVVNWNSNSEGDSWNIADMERLVSVSGGMLWTRGDGAAALFTGTGGTYTSPAGPYAFSTLVQNSGPTYCQFRPESEPEFRSHLNRTGIW